MFPGFLVTVIWPYAVVLLLLSIVVVYVRKWRRMAQLRSRSLPVHFKGNTISTSIRHFVVIDESGRAWSRNDMGATTEQLGRSGNQNIIAPIPGRFASVFCTRISTFLIDLHGSLLVCGEYRGKKYATPTRIASSLHVITEVACNDDTCVLLLDEYKHVWSGAVNGRFFGMTARTTKLEYRRLPNVPPIVQTACHANRIFLLDDTGCVWSAQLGQQLYKTDLDGIIQISAGFKQSIFLGDDGNIHIEEDGDTEHLCGHQCQKSFSWFQLLFHCYK
uniref:Uncharacterized protein n=1 Tax=Vannella robusta TaxID=1487602 RepID=A0A6U1U8S7_9EUKA|mmetsp:Transcript_20194/g.25595  ORF Transcript_20194/g.25595 Transcript_20194/m.25595 type:complete len:275 (+) Transcript_20194:426-1250(+)